MATVMRPSTFNPKNTNILDIVGSNTFGRNFKISPSQTFNMFISDGWLTSTPGYKKKIHFGNSVQGRGSFTSFRGDFTIQVRGNEVYRVSGPANNLLQQFLFNLETFFGKVSIDENIGYQIAICDQKSLWIYDYRAGTVQKAVLPINTQTGVEIIPGYVTYHDGYFIVPDISGSQWYLSPLNNGSGNWNWGAGSVPVAGTIQQKADRGIAVVRMPGKGNLILVLGTISGTMWYNNANSQLFPYQLTNSISIDYGCLSPGTIASMDEQIAFLGTNEKSGPCILISDGGPFTRLSTDGIDYRLERLVSPSESTAMFYRIDGHVFYILTFYNPEDNFTLMYDFGSKKFFYLTDENENYFIASDICSFNDTYYFMSLNDGDLYELSSSFTQYDYTNPGENNNLYLIPRKRICTRQAQPDSSQQVANSLSFMVRQGEDTNYKSSRKRYITTEGGKVLCTETPSGYVGTFFSTELVLEDYQPRIDMSVSSDGGATFGNFVRKFLTALGVRKNRVVFWNFGMNNEFSAQFRFWSKSSVTVSEGVISYREREAA